MSRRRKRKDDRLAKRAFGENVGRRRAALGISKAELAGRAGVSTLAVSTMESGLRGPQFSTMLRLAGALDSGVGDLLDGIRWELPADEEALGRIVVDRRR